METDRGLQVPQELLINLNAVLIVLLVIPVSWAVRKMRTLSAMVIGMTMATAGVLVSGLTNVGGIFLLGVACFSLGEMLTGPKKSEYLGLIAPPGKKGLYLGYVNIPVGIGGLVGAKLQGHFYGHFGEKAVLAQKYLVEHTEFLRGKVWDGKVGSLDAVTGVPRTEAFVKLQEVTGLDAVAATDLLWNTYQPGPGGVVSLRGHRRGGHHRAGGVRTLGAALAGHGCVARDRKERHAGARSHRGDEDHAPLEQQGRPGHLLDAGDLQSRPPVGGPLQGHRALDPPPRRRRPAPPDVGTGGGHHSRT